MPDDSTTQVSKLVQAQHKADEKTKQQPGVCCQFLRQGKCTAPRPPCRLRHVPDDGITPCFYGACCRNGHKNRVLGGMTVEQRLEFWKEYNARRGNTQAAYEDPAKRDVTILRSQLEPWSTAHLRIRLATVFGEDHIEMDHLPRGQIMTKLLQHYDDAACQNRGQQRRKTIRVFGKPVDRTICDELLIHLQAWSEKHKVNSRPSINASSYMILRSLTEFTQNQQEQETTCSFKDNCNNNEAPKMSKKARIAAKKLCEYQELWDLAKQALSTVDPEYAQSFSALAVTKNFKGSPHIDKQNTGPFYGLSMGNFDDGTGGICVEADAFTVAHVNTKYRLAKVDGRYPHWVAPYTFHNLDNDDEKQREGRYRYSLIFYSTTKSYCQPGPAYFGEVVPEDNENVDGAV